MGVRAGGRASRHPKRYKVPVSPLLAVPWWRVAFDEAQMVSSGVSGVSLMAKAPPPPSPRRGRAS